MLSLRPCRLPGFYRFLGTSRNCRFGAQMIPDALRDWLDSWGSRLRGIVQAAARNAHHNFNVREAKLSEVLLVGTDCSGIDAPVHSLRELAIPHRHLFGSEVAAAPRAVIQANTMPSELFQSVLDGDAVPFVHLYVSGFSCKPFSLLHNKSKLLKEDQAQIFFAVVARIEQVRPSCFVLENVTGIKRVSRTVLTALRSKGYCVEMLQMNPADLQEPVQRPRFYFIGVRNDVCLIPTRDLPSWLQVAWASVKEACRLLGSQAGLQDRLLPASHPAVARHQEHRRHKWLTWSQQGFPGSSTAKWRGLHNRCREKLQLQKPSARRSDECSADRLFLHLARERDAWDILTRQHKGNVNLAADLSQNVNRAGARADGTLPTITPGSLLAVAKAGRVIAPLEKILLHAFPIHRMVFPSNVSDKDLGSMGGNTMHVQIVGVAMMFAISLVDWSKAAASKACPCQPGRESLRPSSKGAARIPGSQAASKASKKGPQHHTRQKQAGCPGTQQAQQPRGLTALAARWQRPLTKPKKLAAKSARKKHSRSKVSGKRKIPASDKVVRLARRWACPRIRAGD